MPRPVKFTRPRALFTNWSTRRALCRPDVLPSGESCRDDPSTVGEPTISIAFRNDRWREPSPIKPLLPQDDSWFHNAALSVNAMLCMRTDRKRVKTGFVDQLSGRVAHRDSASHEQGAPQKSSHEEAKRTRYGFGAPAIASAWRKVRTANAMITITTNTPQTEKSFRRMDGGL